MQEDVARFVRGWMLCCTDKPSKGKHCLCHDLAVSTYPGEIISMDFVGGLPTTRKEHDYLFMVVDKLSKMCFLMPCKKNFNGQEATNLFFGQFWVQFGIPRSIISNRDARFLSAFWTLLLEKIDTKLKRSTTFHLLTNGKTLVNKTLLQLLRGYNQKHLNTSDDN